ncbi:hypothetical protein UAW_01185 [Enterococcus haemoperoxidus ATCC BAA-382]|uniref:DUF5673 domain-containing protein n=1 Tax=Enterococcus haemoperoxidus ATCC BAA-382 TaxID=1158608 RepID=R2TEN0_9ENTE|nr:hypothetical protein [Enterococcus haemoperoxidus]EOH98589.1 hypothetical protein UAW_01185 [Enterococcus haemoperoxidus ATCC BAA-382]EOT62228.1 hypothetical protein I583_01228 [Enterococcus haemoperoxidus ATCC BAA-382]
MGIEFFTLLLVAFVVILYVYLILVRKSILIKSIKRKLVYVLVIGFSLLILLLTLTTEQTTDQRIRGFLSVLLVLSFLLDTKGLSDDRIILGPFDKNGILYQDVEKMALLVKKKEIRLNYFKNDRRGPMMKFSIPLEELLAFFSERLNEDAEISILVDEDK